MILFWSEVETGPLIVAIVIVPYRDTATYANRSIAMTQQLECYAILAMSSSVARSTLKSTCQESGLIKLESTGQLTVSFTTVD